MSVTPGARQINVTDIIDRQKLGGFHIALLALAILIMFLDGYDIMAASYAAPFISKDLGVNSLLLTPMLTASLFGILVGSLVGGYVGDRLGRRPVIIVAMVTLGLLTLGAAVAENLDQLMVLRFLAGISIGAVMPNTVSLIAEFAPQRMRATFIIITFTGVSLGSALPGFFSPWLATLLGWRAIFVVGGVLPLVLAALLFFALPESVKFLALDPRRNARTVKILRKMDASSDAREDDQFVEANAAAPRRGRLADLFNGRDAVLTPLLWALFIINFMVLYFFNSWMPTLLVQAGASPNLAGIATALFQLGGMLGGLILSRFIDRRGLFPVFAYFVAAVPLVALVGQASSAGAIIGLTFTAGFCVVGLQYGLNATAGVLYPTHIRSNGVGFALGMGRVGAVMGPLFGAVLMSAKMDISFALAAIPMALGAVICFMLARARRTLPTPP